MQGSSDFDTVLLGGISSIIKSFNFDFEKRPVEIIEISYNNLIITRDELSKHMIVLKYSREITEKKITKELEKIVKQYQSAFKQKSLQGFAKYVNKLLRIAENKGDVIHNFLTE